MTSTNQPISKEARTLRTIAKVCLGLCIIAAAFLLMTIVLQLSDDNPSDFIGYLFAGVIILPILGFASSARLNALATITEAAQLYKDKHALQLATEQPKDTIDQQGKQ